MSLFLALMVQAAQPTQDALDMAPDADLPPVELIDFLGRRHGCAYRGVPRGELNRLRCAALPNEERRFRNRFAADARALRWLNQDPLAFRMDRRLIVTLDSSEPTIARRTEQSGVDDEGRPYRLLVDRGATGGGSTVIALAYAGWPERRFTLRNGDFPLLDLQTLLVTVAPEADDPRLWVRMRFGHPRGYCGEHDLDDREQVTITFTRNEVTGYVTRRTNCQRVYERIGRAGR